MHSGEQGRQGAAFGCRAGMGRPERARCGLICSRCTSQGRCRAASPLAQYAAGSELAQPCPFCTVWLTRLKLSFLCICCHVPQNGFDGWLAKPFRVEEFARVLAACRSGSALTPKRPS